MKEITLTGGSLCAGIGGFELAMESNGIGVAWANEMEPKMCEIYRHNFGHPLLEGRMEDMVDRFTHVDILTAGFPCQPFSVAGRRFGFSDFRGQAIFSIANIVKNAMPKAILLENVKGLVSHNGGQTFGTILSVFEHMGYTMAYRVLNTANYTDIPQNRERVFIAGFLDPKVHGRFSFPELEQDSRRITDFLESDADPKYVYGTESKIFPFLQEAVVKTNTVYQWRRKYVRENKSGVCPTLTKNMGTGGHNVPIVLQDGDIRKLTPRECFRLQGFPDSYSIPKDLYNRHAYMAAGNSVTVPLVAKVIANMKNAMVFAGNVKDLPF